MTTTKFYQVSDSGTLVLWTDDKEAAIREVMRRRDTYRPPYQNLVKLFETVEVPV